MTLGSLFDGISGFPLAASWAGIETKWISEIDPFCLKVSKKNFPNAVQYGDIKEIGIGRKWQPEAVDIICGGFPCQSFSSAGKGAMDLSLWKEMLRIISEVRPGWVVVENVFGLVTRKQGMAIEAVCADLENEGYSVFPPLILPACSVEAWHKRDRVWIVAYSNTHSDGFGKKLGEKTEEGCNANKINTTFSVCPDVSYTRSNGLEVSIQNGNSNKTKNGIKQRGEASGRDSEALRRMWDAEPKMGRVVDGISFFVEQIRGFGNAIVPQVAFEIFKAIKLTLDSKTN
jgi:DNA (cytosine-5)-methyltransferase 1